MSYEHEVAACPTPIYHETHRYCPSCPWTEQGDIRVSATVTNDTATETLAKSMRHVFIEAQGHPGVCVDCGRTRRYHLPPDEEDG